MFTATWALLGALKKRMVSSQEYGLHPFLSAPLYNIFTSPGRCMLSISCLINSECLGEAGPR